MPIKAERLNELMQLAQDRFNNLSDPERKLLQRLANGKEANYSSYDERPPLRASLIAWLCTDVDACKFITHQGLTITGAAIKGFLNLKSANLEFPLRFQECCFTRTIDFSEAKLKLLDLSGSQIILSKTRITNNGEWETGINAENVYVGGDVFLSDGFSSNGKVNFYRARIDGDFDCSYGTFSNDEGDALTAKSMEVKGSILFIGSEIEAFETAVLLTGSEISRDLECDGARLYSSKGNALFFSSGSIGASALFYNEFQADGKVYLCGTTIGNNFECDNSIFNNPSDALLVFWWKWYPKIQNDEFWKAEVLDFWGLNLAYYLIFRRTSGGKSLLVENIEIKGSFLIENCQFSGGIWIENSTIKGSIKCISSTLNDLEEYALLIQNTSVGGSINLAKSSYTDQEFESRGQICLTGTSIGGNFECSSGTFTQGKKYVLFLLGTRVGRSIVFQNCTFIGLIRLLDVTVNDSLETRGIHNPDKMILDLRFSKIRVLSDSENSWPQPEKLLLDGLVYERIHNNSPANYKSRLRWLRLQPKNNYFSLQSYEQLVKVFREGGHEDSAREILIAKKRDHRRYRVLRGELKRLSFEWPKDHFLERTIAYGYKPFQVLPWMGCFIAIGALLLWLGYLSEPKLISPARVDPFYEIPPKQLEFSEDYPKFDPFFYSIDAFIPILNLHQQDYWLPNANREKFIDVWPPQPICSPSRREHVQIFLFKLRLKFTGACLRWYLWFHIFAGWILTSLFVAGLTGLVRRIN